MDSDIQQRRAIRAENARKAAEKADALRLKGNEFFKQGDYLSACVQYIRAIDIQGPRPILLSNLAACYNKLPCPEAAEELATRALEYDPRAVKVRYRRVTARKHMLNFDSAIKDLDAILAQDPTNAEAQREFAQISQITDVGYPMDKDDDEWPRNTVEPYDFAEDSDTEDCKHKPERPPCRFYNRGRCDRGASCRFSHAPDALSVRDELGRNVCSRFLMGSCRSDETKCLYSHSRAHLPASGWWDSPEAIEAARHLKGIVEDEDSDYGDHFHALRMHPKGHGYAARRSRQLLTEWIHELFGTTVASTILHAEDDDDDELPAPPSEPFVLVVDFEYEGTMDFLHGNLFSAMAAKIKLVHVRGSSNGEDMTVRHLTSPHIAGVLVTDEEAICSPVYLQVAEKLVEYAKGGGTVVLGGKIANELRGNVFDHAMKNMWGLEWKYGSYFRTTFSTNPDNAVVKGNPTLLPSYSMKALHIAGTDPRDAVYVQTIDSRLQSLVYPPVNVSAISKRDEAPAVFSKVGKGHLGFVGDVNIESGTIELTMAMLGILTPKQAVQDAAATAGSSTMTVNLDGKDDASSLPSKITDKYVVALQLNPPVPGSEDQFHDQICRLSKKIRVKLAKNATDAINVLSTANVHGVLVMDKGIANPPNAGVLKTVVQHVKDGGLVVFAGSFPGDTKVDKDKVVTVFSAFGLPWTSGPLWGKSVYINEHHATAITNPSLPDEYSLSAHNLHGFHFEDMLYETPTREESPILRARVGKGYVGYVGDVNPEPESTTVILSMFGLLDPPRELVRDEEKFMLFITAYNKDTLGAPADGFLEDIEGKVKIIFGLGDLSKPRVVDLLESPDLVGVFVGDTAVLMPQNAYFLSQLVKYSKNGGTLVFGWLFPELVTLTQFRPLFRDNWGLEWDILRNVDATVASNPKNALIKSHKSDKLPAKFHYQGIYVEGIPASAAVYFSRMKSLWNPGENIYTSSLIFTEVEKGKLGFFGSSSLDGECRTILYAMMGIV